MIPIAFNLDSSFIVVGAFVLVAIVVGVAIYHTEQKDRRKQAVAEFRDDLILLDPTLVQLAPVNLYGGYSGHGQTLSLHEVKRLADLQRNQDQKRKDYTDLEDAKQRLKTAREEQQ